MPLASVHFERTRALNNLFGGYDGPPFSIRMPGWYWRSALFAPAVFTLVFRVPEALRLLMEGPTEITLGEAFVSGKLDVEGDLFAAFDAVRYRLARPLGLQSRVAQHLTAACFAMANRFVRGRLHSKMRDASSISYHYDLPETFYEPWLGPTLLYSAAYFRDAANGLDRAQTDKLDLICRKLLLDRDDRFIDIGCGWGTLAIYATSQYGTQTRGITISQQQARIAARRIADAHLKGRCFVENRDYRDALQLPYRFDKAASIGMFEHVGLRRLRKYFRVVHDLLNPGGLFLNSGIVRSSASPPQTLSFIDRYVFPDGELPTLSFALREAEAVGLEVRDLENLREHYAQTLRIWVKNLQQQTPTLLHKVSERTLRTWLLYMAGSAVAFDRGEISLYQILLQRPEPRNRSSISTRENRYKDKDRASRPLAA